MYCRSRNILIIIIARMEQVVEAWPAGQREWSMKNTLVNDLDGQSATGAWHSSILWNHDGMSRGGSFPSCFHVHLNMSVAGCLDPMTE